MVIILQTNLLEFVFGDINRNSIFSKDVYQSKTIIKDVIQKLKDYDSGK